MGRFFNKALNFGLICVTLIVLFSVVIITITANESEITTFSGFHTIKNAYDAHPGAS